jgi:hypothetical protein
MRSPYFASLFTSLLLYLGLTVAFVQPTTAFATGTPETDTAKTVSEAMEEDELDIEFMDELETSKAEEKPKSNLQFRGFVDTRWGTRLKSSDNFDRQTSLAETRFQGNIKFSAKKFKFNVKADLVHDDIIDGTHVDVREAYIELPANDYAQVRIGRQNIMWGLGDLMVANDVFPKDFMGLYYGRDAEAEYMVTSSDALRTSIFLDDSTLDIVWSQFVPWDVPTGERFSYFNPFLQQTVGEKNVLDIKENHNGSVMARWSTNLLGQEVALYYNRSRWQSPDGFNPQTQELFYPRLNTYGFSTRGELGKGILSLDASYYQSAQDKEGDKFWIRNSEIRFILGYEFELATDLNVSFQWYQEQHQQQSQNLSSLAPGMEAAPREYNLLTMRLNQFLLSQKMTLSMFLYYSPTQKDSYLRLNMFHKFDDHWMINIGTNHFSGAQDARFGQLEENSNAFAAVRWSF